MLTDNDYNNAASSLLAAERDRKPAGRLSDRHPGLDIADAYAIQRVVVDRRLKAGSTVVGHKIGLTSKVMQRSVGIDEPDFGHLLSDMVYDAGTPIAADRFLLPRIEVELAFVLDRPLKGPGVTVTDVLDATAYVQPALEIIDSRTEVPRKVTDTIADNSACGAVVLGGRPVRPDTVDLCRLAAVLYRNGEIEESGVSVAVMGHPAAAIAWLANKLSEFGIVLEPGEVLLAGSFTRPVPLAAGDVFHIDFHELGAIAVTFQ